MAGDSASGPLQLPSNALFLRLPDAVRPEAVADALMEAVAQLLPRLDCNLQRDVQVRAGKPLWLASWNTCVTVQLQPATSRQCLPDTLPSADSERYSSSGTQPGVRWRHGAWTPVRLTAGGCCAIKDREGAAAMCWRVSIPMPQCFPGRCGNQPVRQAT